MPHYVAKNHFLNPEASVVALDHHCEQYQLDYEFPEKINFFSVSAKNFTRSCHSILRTIHQEKLKKKWNSQEERNSALEHMYEEL